MKYDKLKKSIQKLHVLFIAFQNLMKTCLCVLFRFLVNSTNNNINRSNFSDPYSHVNYKCLFSND